MRLINHCWWFTSRGFIFIVPLFYIDDLFQHPHFNWSIYMFLARIRTPRLTCIYLSYVRTWTPRLTCIYLFHVRIWTPRFTYVYLFRVRIWTPRLTCIYLSHPIIAYISSAPLIRFFAAPLRCESAPMYICGIWPAALTYIYLCHVRIWTSRLTCYMPETELPDLPYLSCMRVCRRFILLCYLSM